MRGTILNTIAVVLGSSIGLLSGGALSESYKPVALTAIGLVIIGFGIKSFLETKNVLVPMISLVVGGMLGVLIGLDTGIDHLAEWTRLSIGGGGTFNEGLISASVLFCVGPMTLLGCIKDALERDIKILSIKSILDFVSSTFLAATLGVGVLVSAVVLLVIQGGITLLAKPLKPFVDHSAIIGDASATGGLILLAIGQNLLGVVHIPTELFVPSLLIAPFISRLFEKFQGTENHAKN